MKYILSHTRAVPGSRFRAGASLSLVVARDASPILSSGFLHGNFVCTGSWYGAPNAPPLFWNMVTEF